MVYCILLLQYYDNPETRTFADFNTVSDMIAGVPKCYEQYLKIKHPRQVDITYTLASLMNFLDTLHDMSCMIYDKQSNMYKPYNRAWIKEKVHNFFTHKYADEQIEFEEDD